MGDDVAGERAIDLTNTGRLLYRVPADEPTATATLTTRAVRRVVAQRIAPNGTAITFHWQSAPAFSSGDQYTSSTCSTRELTRTRARVALVDDPSQLEAVRDARVAVLARKYENPESAEHEARFRLLTEKLRSLDPRVSEDEHAALAESTALLENSVDLIAKIKRVFGV
jgi:hypothetical protein